MEQWVSQRLANSISQSCKHCLALNVSGRHWSRPNQPYQQYQKQQLQQQLQRRFYFFNHKSNTLQCPRRQTLSRPLIAKPTPQRALPLFAPHSSRKRLRLYRSYGHSDSTTMATTVEVASVPSADTPGTCIYMHHDKRAYVFGRVAEGTQRAFGSRKVSMGGTEQVFLSGSISWEQLGGLCGYLLSVGGSLESAKEFITVENKRRKDNNMPQLSRTRQFGVGVHGADNLGHILAVCRPVIFRQPICVQTFEQREDPRAVDIGSAEPDWSDDAIRVWKLPVERARSSSPRKRRHSSPRPVDGAADSPQDNFKPGRVVSDPGVASSIVERIMFNGSLNNKSVLMPVKLGQLKPSDKAVIVENGLMRLYKGPFATDGAEIPNSNNDAWKFPDAGEVEVEEGKDNEVLAINHYPLPRTAYSETSMSYIIKCHDRRGKFNAPAARALGVPIPSYKLLTAGQSVTLESGKVITPDMVLGETQPGRGIIVADIESRDFLDSFMARPEWKSAELMANIAIVYWILGPGMADDAQIQKFTSNYPQIKHIFCAKDTCPNMITHHGVGIIQSKLRRIDPDRFPNLDYNNEVQYPAPPADSPIELGRAGTKLQLMPKLVFDDLSAAPFPDLDLAYHSLDDEILAMAQKAKEEATDPSFLARIEEAEQDIPNRDAEIIPLGTGSSVPSKYRNVSGTLIRVPGIGNYLLDCGEGTLGQIRRLFGAEEAADVLRNLRCIVISHPHADHHIGTPSLIKAWYEQTLKDGSNATLAISCIGRYRILLEEVSQVEDIGFHRLRFPSCPIAKEKDRDLTTSEDLGEENFGLASIKRIPVPHCWRSYATQLELTSGLRIAYSGDCRPSRLFAQECEGAHLLVHECTFGDDKQDHAKAKKHSTMGEALGVARNMKARRTLLTHFSQRYSKSGSLRQDRVEGEENSVLLAFDFMRVRLGDFQKAACYIPAVQRLMEKLD